MNNEVVQLEYIFILIFCMQDEPAAGFLFV